MICLRPYGLTWRRLREMQLIRNQVPPFSNDMQGRPQAFAGTARFRHVPTQRIYQGHINQPDIARPVVVCAIRCCRGALPPWLTVRPVADDAVERLLDARLHSFNANKDTNMLLSPYQAKVSAMLGLCRPDVADGERSFVDRRSADAACPVS